MPALLLHDPEQNEESKESERMKRCQDEEFKEGGRMKGCQNSERVTMNPFQIIPFKYNLSRLTSQFKQNDFAVQVDFEFPEKVQAQDQTEHAHECHGSTQLTQENDELLKSTAILSPESMKCNEDKVQFYTGLPNYATLILIIQNGLPLNGKLSHFQQILLVLMKLRLNLEEQDLAYRFSVSQSTVSRVLLKVDVSNVRATQVFDSLAF
ncbi:hypothetical protein EMCRGX_G027808 [Ephydatia muelleri]|eukprot:Em0020g806a